MKHIIYLIFSPLAVFAINPSLPVVRLDSGNIADRRGSIPERYTSERGETINYNAAGFSTWYADGWRQASITIITNQTVTSIPASIQAVAAAYKAKMEEIYGSGAVTNRALTEAAVAIDLSLRNDITADTGVRLQTWFKILDGYWGKGEIWTFPYGATSYTNTSAEEVWEAVP